MFVLQRQRKGLRVMNGRQASQRQGLTSEDVQLLLGTSRELPGSVGNLWGTSAWGNSALLLESTVRNVRGKSPGRLWGSSGKFGELQGLGH